jgi:predicted dehydrogenase
MRNWLYFTWLSGDHIVEQAVHSLDKMAWAMKDEPPVKATAVGGRQVRTSPNYGHIFDHFGVVYEYKNGVKMFHTCRQQELCENEISDFVFGTRGTASIVNQSDPKSHRISGANPWECEVEGNNMYQTEHDELFASIRKGKPINDGDRMLKSTLLAILGRTAAYTGRVIKWDDLLKSEVDWTPKTFVANGYSLADLPTPRVAIPGRTKVTDTLW